MHSIKSQIQIHSIQLKIKFIQFDSLQVNSNQDSCFQRCVWDWNTFVLWSQTCCGNSTTIQKLDPHNHSIHKTMIPYFAKRVTKQLTCGKPIRFGFQLWCLALTDRYLFQAEPWCGADTKLSNTGFGQGSDVMLNLVEKSGLSTGFFVTFDKLFASFSLLDELSKRGIRGLVTIRKNRLENAAIPSKQTIKKTEEFLWL